MPREWDNPIRKPWNPKIHNIIKTIDLHVELYIKTGDEFHLKQSEILRNYIKSLKLWIHKEENS
ncbi:hypothetical protein EBR43_11290 [bacterium]|jgi:hypothetical protein|nr:hypothetical protein [bacterium]